MEKSLITGLTGLSPSRNPVLSMIRLHKSTYHHRHTCSKNRKLKRTRGLQE